MTEAPSNDTTFPWPGAGLSPSTAAQTATILASVPVGPGVFALESADGQTIQYGGVDHLQARLRYYLTEAGAKTKSGRATSRHRANLGADVAQVRYRATRGRFETRLALVELARRVKPADYRTELRLTPAAYLWADTPAEAFPRLVVRQLTEELLDADSRTPPTAQPGRNAPLLIGPLANRAAAEACRAALAEVFALCACRQARAGAVDHKTCPLWQMGRCQTPADRPELATSYGEVFAHLADFAVNPQANPWPQGLAQAMQTAAAALAFEEANRLKARWQAANTLSHTTLREGCRGRPRQTHWLALDAHHRDPRQVLVLAMRAGWWGRVWSVALDATGRPAPGQPLADIAHWLTTPDSLTEALAMPTAMRVDHLSLLADLMARDETSPTRLLAAPNGLPVGALADELQKIFARKSQKSANALSSAETPEI